MHVRKLGVGLSVVAALVMGWAAVASAHVTVQPSSVAQGSYAKIAFRVPNEKDVPTVGLRVKFPDDHPIPAARVKPVAGWEATITPRTLDTPIKVGEREITEVVDTIEWRGGEIGVDEFQEFEVSLAPAPRDAPSVLFPAIQYYADGSEVAWIEPPATDGADVAHPAPVLTLTAAAATGDAHGGTGATTTTADGGSAGSSDGETQAAAAGTETSESSDVIAWVGFVIALAALVLALAGLARSGAKRSS